MLTREQVDRWLDEDAPLWEARDSEAFHEFVWSLVAGARAEGRAEALEEAARLFEPTNTWNLHFCMDHPAQVIRTLAALAPEGKP